MSLDHENKRGNSSLNLQFQKKVKRLKRIGIVQKSLDKVRVQKKIPKTSCVRVS